jgi:DNA gyrase subunit A
MHGRGGQGVIAIQVTERNGRVVGAIAADDNDEVMLISGGGTLVRTRVNEISVMGRNTQGVRLITLAGDETLVGIERIVEERDENGDVVDATTGQDAE